MFAKVFTQIFDSSIAKDCRVRHVFEDLLKLADIDGVVDMTLDAIARRTNVPIDEVAAGIAVLSAPDPDSRSHEHEGRRLMLIDSHRSWGWQITNYTKYRSIKDEEGRRKYWRDLKAINRAMSPRKRKRKSGLSGVDYGQGSARERLAVSGITPAFDRSDEDRAQDEAAGA